MRVAALYDIHGNLPALEAVLAELDRLEPDVILFGGDLSAGPLPTETLNLLMGLDERARFIRGNADRFLVECYDRGQGPEEMRGLIDVWSVEQLTQAQRDFLAALPERAIFEIDGLGPTLFCHGSPRSDEEIITAATSDDRLRPMLAGLEQRIVVCGHTHVQFDRVLDGVRVVNAGSVGMPYGAPGAHWALLGPQIDLRQTPYDLEEAARRIRQSGWPHAAEFAQENVLERPSASEAIELFERQAAEKS